MNITNTYGMSYLKNKLNQKRSRVLTRYSYYNMKNLVRDLNISTPPDLQYWMNSLGWCGKSVDVLANKLRFRKFKEDNFGVNEIFELNNPDIFKKAAIKGALVTSCDFIYIFADSEGYPKLQVIDGGNATGVIDTTTGLLFEGYAVLSRDAQDQPSVEAYFTSDKTYIYQYGTLINSIPNPTGYPLLVPIIFNPDESRPFGHSRISRACMDIQNAAVRCIKRSEIAAEFYSYPQKWVSGLSEDAEIDDRWKATMSSLLTFTKDEDNDRPVVGQFQAGSMSPHVEQIKMFASLFAGESGLTLEDMGFPLSNPSSQETIKASHETLKTIGSSAQDTIGSGFLNVGYLAACLRDNRKYNRYEFSRTKPRWFPMYEPDASSMSGLGDALIKIEQARPNTITTEFLEDLTGFTFE